ncbi:MAG: DNA translocase FtsK [Clostridiales bacterium]|nr:DNA translocase FtsK [Clostridiales bacterium]
MAQKNPQSRADRAVTDAKKKASPKKGTASAKKNQAQFQKEPVSFNIIAALVSAALFVLFLVISINPDGILLRAIQSFLLGMIGQAGFYFSIPALLYLFVIHTFGRKTNVTMRSICVLVFVFLCGSIYHLAVQNQPMAEGFAVVKDLYLGGGEGITGGVLCGGFAMLLRWACGNVMSFILCGLAAAVALLGAMQITIPSIIRAIANRPREDWDEEEQREYVEPATVVVNHIATKQIEYKRQKRQKLEAAREQQEIHPEPVPKQEKIPSSDRVPTSGRAEGVMSQMELDVCSPVGAASEGVREEEPGQTAPEPKITPAPAVKFENIPKKMPELEIDVPSFVNPKKDSVQKKPDSLQEAKPKKTDVVREPPAPKEPEPKPGKITSKDAAESAAQVAEEIAQAQGEKKAAYCFPPIDLLKKPLRCAADGTDEMRENSRRLNETLASFKIDAHIINVTRGPSVTRYEVELDKGVRLNKLTSCADDIALSLGASGVRIAAVPGKISIVGIEVPNRAVTTVTLREVIDSAAFAQSRSKSSFAVGKDIGGTCIVGNIAKMPHMLIAGTTGSGKSVCMNSIIISLLYKASPDDVKLIMVDPKMVELGIYNGIPHLLIPVVTDPKKAAGSLQWAVTEMLRRYKLMSDAGVRDLESYNGIVSAEDGQKLPQVVIIIDELADLMLVAAKEVEDSICRIAQMGRASGMHLIIATQRPSADVITGLMKANIPSRIAFSVASAMESRIILDTQGAEKLVGKGDMLYAPIGSGKPLRVQGCFVTDGEVEAVASYVKENYVCEYNEEVLEEIERKAQQTGKSKPGAPDPEPNPDELEGDEMLPAAVDVILETGQASVSMLQRRLKLGYARAARIVDEMEEKGIVGPFQGSKPRAILLTKEQWQAMRSQGTQMNFDDLQEDFGPVPEELD